MELRKDDSPNRILSHPLFTGKTSVGMVSGESPKFSGQAAGHEVLGETLKQMGLKAEPVQGYYGGPERSYVVHGPTREQMYRLGKQFGQESVVYSNAGQHELMYTGGPQAGRHHPATGHEVFSEAPEDYYTHLPAYGGYLRLNFDWDKLHDSKLTGDAALEAQQDRAQHEMQKAEPDFARLLALELDLPVHDLGDVRTAVLTQLRKSLPMAHPHPHAYHWHNHHTDHHLHVMAPGVVVRSGAGLTKADPGHPHMDTPPVNEQAGTSSDYHRFAMPYGSVAPGQQTDLWHYPLLQDKTSEVNQLLKDHGYNHYYAGGKFGRPDLANRNYNTGHLMVYDPSPGSGGDFGHEAYTDNWRKVHELAHALTLPELNAQYGEGRRIGKLGTHRTLREGLRAVHWEHLAAHKQRELMQKVGVQVPDQAFNREYNTVMHDAIHRAVTGKFSEPSQMGFKPYSHQIPLETGLGMVREAAHNLGLQGMHDLKKSEDNMADEKIYEPKEWRQELAKALRERVQAYGQEMLRLRERELQKAETSIAPAAPALNPMDNCPLCGQPDMPGQCRCLQGPAAGAQPAVTVNVVHSSPDVAGGMEKAGMKWGVYTHNPNAEGDPLSDEGNHHARDVHELAVKLGHKKGQYKVLDEGDGQKHILSHDKTLGHVVKPMKKADRPEVVPQNSPEEKKFREDNAKATAAGKRGIPLPPKGSPERRNLSLAHDRPPFKKDEVEDREKKKIELVPEEPVKAQEGSGGKVSKGLKKGAMSGMARAPQGASAQAAADAHRAVAVRAPAPKVALPGPAAQAARAQDMAAFTPPGKFGGAGAGLPPAGVGHLKSPYIPGLKKAGLPAAGPKPAAMPKPAGGAPGATPKPPGTPKPAAAGAMKPPTAAKPAAAPKPAVGQPALKSAPNPGQAFPVGKGEKDPVPKPKGKKDPVPKPRPEKSELTKSMGDCLLCGGPEHSGDCQDT